MALDNGNNFYNAVAGAMGLFGATNKSRRNKEDDTESAILDEFESSMKEEDITNLTTAWEEAHNTYIKDIKDQQTTNEDYWKGKQFNEFQTAGTKKPLVDNLLFEALETFLPIATRANPEVNVSADGTDEGEKIADAVQKALHNQAEKQHLRMKLKGMTRNWAIYLIGALKISWDYTKNNSNTDIVLPKHLILDPESVIEVGGIYNGEYLGLRKKKTAKKLIELFPKKEKEIKLLAQGKLGTKIQYIEWWTRTDVFFTLRDNKIVLGKYKNPNWNYNGKVKVIDPETESEIEEEVQGINHFEQPEFPFIFLTIFNLGTQPHDNTSLMTQNIAIQDNINKRYQQIDKNVDAQNNGIVLSGDAFTKEQAAEAATQLSKGNALWVPNGKIGDSYKRDNAPALPANIYQQLEDSRNELRNIFGTSGSTPQGLEDQKSVRGKILVNQMDSSRIGGGVTEFIEKVANTWYNWQLQMIYVYWTEEHSFSVLGEKSRELMKLKNTQLTTRFTVTVKEGSLIPKDPLTKRNEAMDLWSAGAIDPISFYKALDYPNAYDMAEKLLKWQLIQKGVLPPQVLFPDFEIPQPQALPPNTSPAVSNGEDNRNITTPVPNAPDITGQQLMQSVKI